MSVERENESSSRPLALQGHKDWITSMAFRDPVRDPNGGGATMLATASAGEMADTTVEEGGRYYVES